MKVSLVKRFFNSKEIFIACFFFVFLFDATFTIFGLEGGLHDGINHYESNPNIRDAVAEGSFLIPFLIVLGTSIWVGLQLYLWGIHWTFRTAFWLLLLFRFLLFTIL